jgi:hypothetical protein
MRPTLRFLGAMDVVSGVVALAAASWLGDQLDVSTTVVRVAGVALLVLGAETLALSDRRVMATTTAVVEGAVALVAVDLAILGDPTGVGTALLLATAAYCATAAVRVARLRRSSSRAESLVPA